MSVFLLLNTKYFGSQWLPSTVWSLTFFKIIFCAPQKKEIQYRFATTTWGWTIPLKCMHLSIIKILSPSKCLIELCCICRVLQARMSVSAQTAASGRVTCACGPSLVMLWARRVTCTLLSLDWLRSCAAASAELPAGEPEPQTERRCSRPAQGTALVYYCRSQVMNVKVEVTVQWKICYLLVSFKAVWLTDVCGTKRGEY